MYLKGFITNLGKYHKGKVIGEWIEFPIDEDDFEDVLERIEIDGENYKDYIFTMSGTSPAEKRSAAWALRADPARHLWK